MGQECPQRKCGLTAKRGTTVERHSRDRATTAPTCQPCLHGHWEEFPLEQACPSPRQLAAICHHHRHFCTHTSCGHQPLLGLSKCALISCCFGLPVPWAENRWHPGRCGPKPKLSSKRGMTKVKEWKSLCPPVHATDQIPAITLINLAPVEQLNRQ